MTRWAYDYVCLVYTSWGFYLRFGLALKFLLILVCVLWFDLICFCVLPRLVLRFSLCIIACFAGGCFDFRFYVGLRLIEHCLWIMYGFYCLFAYCLAF